MSTVRVANVASTSARAFTDTECDFIMSVLNDERSWGPRFVWSVALEADWLITLERQSEIDRLPGVKGLSVTYMGRPRMTAFSYENWMRVPQAVADVYTRSQYRTYLVLHEAGHMLGLDHAVCRGGPAPVMVQQTRGLGACKPNVWPRSP